MRSFRDSNDVEWTVFEVRRQIARADLPEPLQLAGWLCFENDVAKRRLLRYPERWREFADTELARLLQEATPAPRASLSLGGSVEGGSTTAGA